MWCFSVFLRAYWEAFGVLFLVVFGGMECLNVAGQALEPGSFDGAPFEESAIVFDGEALPVCPRHLLEFGFGLEVFFGSGRGKTVPWAGFGTAVAAIKAPEHFWAGADGELGAGCDGEV